MNARLVVVWLLGFVLTTSVCCDDHPTKPRVEPGWHFLGLEEMNVNSLELDYPHLYACAWQNGLYRSDVALENPEWEHLGLSSSAFHGVSSGILEDVLVLEGDTLLTASSYRASNGTNYPGVHRSEDKGITWVRADSGIRLDDGRVCRATCLTGCGHFSYAGTVECGTYRSDDGGRHWDLSGGCRGCGYSHDWIKQSPADCSIIWQAGSTATESYAIGASRDHGATWNWVHPTHGFLDTYVIALDPLDADIAYVGMRDSVAVTVDLGESFQTIMYLPERAWTMALANGPSSGHVFVAAGVYHQDTQTIEPFLYEIQDAGAVIDTLAIPTTEPVSDLLCDVEHQALYAATKRGVYKYVY